MILSVTHLGQNVRFDTQPSLCRGATVGAIAADEAGIFETELNKLLKVVCSLRYLKKKSHKFVMNLVSALYNF